MLSLTLGDRPVIFTLHMMKLDSAAHEPTALCAPQRRCVGGTWGHGECSGLRLSSPPGCLRLAPASLSLGPMPCPLPASVSSSVK